MNDTEKNQICQALATADPANINATCRDILCKRLQWDKQPDRKLRFLLEDIVKTINFPLSYAVSETVVANPHSPDQQSGIRKTAIFAVLALIGIGICLADITFLSVLGVLMATVAGYGIGHSTAPKHIEPVMKQSVVRIATTAESLGREVDSVYDSLICFYKYRQLDGRNIRILAWLQHFYADGATKEEKDSIERLLSLYGYTFRNFAEDNCADFDVYTGNVSFPTTTEPSIYNEDGVAVCKGTAVIPPVG